MAVARPAARVICLDGRGRVLLLHWHDPAGERTFWEPPGGGLDPGETPLEAARRELREETGLPGDAVLDVWVPVDRDFHWRGVRYVTTEPFYLARFDHTPAVVPAALTAEELEAYLGHGWHPVDGLPPTVEPSDLDAVLRALL